jgi:hypothetical protein
MISWFWLCLVFDFLTDLLQVLAKSPRRVASGHQKGKGHGKQNCHLFHVDILETLDVGSGGSDEAADVNEVTMHRRRCRHGGADQVRAATRALAAFKVAVAG